MTQSPPSGPVNHASSAAQSNHYPAGDGPPRALIASALISLLLGMVLVFLGIGVGEVADLWTSGLAIILIVGVVFLVVAFGARSSMREIHSPDASTGLALFVAIELLGGLALAFIAILNLAFDSEGANLPLTAVTVFGLLLVTDSMLFYWNNFKHSPGK